MNLFSDLRALAVRIAVIALAIAFCDGALCEAMYDRGGVRISLVSAAATDIGAELVIAVSADAEADIILTEPMVNGEPACFSTGWCAEEFSARPETAEYPLVFESFDYVPADEISFRVIEGGVFSGRIRVSGIGGESPVAGYETGDDPQLVRGDIAADGSGAEVQLTDNTAAEKLELLDYCRAMVLYVNDDGTMSQIAMVNAACDAAGRASALWSGYIVSINGGAVIPVIEDGQGSIGFSGTLLGDYLFFASADIDIELAEDSSACAGVVLSSPELSQECSNIPLSYFTSFDVTSARYVMGDDWLSTVGFTGISADLSEQIEVKLTRPAAGDNIVYCFMYYYTDYTSEISGIYPVAQ